MQVSCPNCRARYAVDPLAIGPAGRTVQCARCSERWFQTVKIEPPSAPPPAAPSAHPAAASPAAATPTPRQPAAGKPSPRRLLPWLFRPTPKKEPDAEPQPQARPEAEQPKTSARAIDTMPAMAPAPDFVIRPATRGAMLPALIEPKADRRMSLALIGVVTLLVLLAVGVLAFHNVIADQLPPEWRSILQFDHA